MKYAPYVVPTLCRSEHFIRMMESLKRNTWACYTDVIVSVDYPPSEKYIKGWQEICDYLDQGDFSVFKQLIVFKQTENLGVGHNNAFLYNFIIQRYDRWIRCDDDCEFSPNFLEYMDKCLDKFDDDEDVVAVTGYSYPIDWSVSDGATCMKQQFNVASWGLGRWVKKHDVVASYIRSGKMLDDAEIVVRNGRYKKMSKRCYTQYFNQVTTNRKGTVKAFMTGVTDISLRAYLACQDKYCISPVISKVRNYGFDGSGAVCQNTIGKDDSSTECYDYRNQEIDTADHFDLVLNDPQLLHKNKLKMDAFDGVSKRCLWYTDIKFWIVKCLGVKFARKLDGALVSVVNLMGLRKRKVY